MRRKMNSEVSGGCPVWAASTRLPQSVAPGPSATFRVPPGVPCVVRRRGELRWVRHTTRRETVYARCEAREGEHLVFRLGGWVMRVRERFVAREAVRPGPDCERLVRALVAAAMRGSRNEGGG